MDAVVATVGDEGVPSLSAVIPVGYRNCAVRGAVAVAGAGAGDGGDLGGRAVVGGGGDLADAVVP